METRWHCLLPALLLSLPLHAAETEAPLTVQAASMEADRAKEISVFRGDVQIDKGNVHIESDEARLRAVEGEIHEGTLIGKPVRFRQQPAEGALITGEASRIEYDAVKGVIVLTGGAWVRQGTDEFRGETIRYDIEAGKVLAQSSEKVPERVKIIFQPKTATPSETPSVNPAKPIED